MEDRKYGMDKESVYVLDEPGRIAYVLMERLMIFLSLKVMGVLLTLFFGLAIVIPPFIGMEASARMRVGFKDFMVTQMGGLMERMNLVEEIRGSIGNKK
ncbi:MAG: hypothetical protein ACLUWB_18470 [Parabacteroides distasonis]